MAVLPSIGFLSRNKAPEAFEHSLCRDLWTLVKGDELQGVTFDTLLVIFLSIIGIRTKDREIVDTEYNSIATINLSKIEEDGDLPAPTNQPIKEVSKMG